MPLNHGAKRVTDHNDKEKELLEAAVRCYSVCHAGFDETISMISSSRGMSSGEAIRILESAKRKYSSTKYYKALRARLPKNFPI